MSTYKQDIKDLMAALTAINTISLLLKDGRFTYGYHDLLTSSFAFLKSLHEQVLESALVHPDADSIPELVEFKNNLVKEEQK